MKVALLGDIGLFGKYDLKQNKNAFNNLEQVADFLNKQDFVVGNLETPFTKEEHTSTAKSAHIKSDPVNVELLKFLNIKAVNLANNHLCDYGYNGYK